MQDFASVLPDWVFVQTAEAVRIKFKSSVAGGMHSCLPASQTGTLRHLATRPPEPLKTVFAVDRG
jgi:hypothetical protein